MGSRRHIVLYCIIFNIFYSLVHMEFRIEILPPCDNHQLVEADAMNIPHIQSDLHTDVYNVTSRFNVGFIDKHVVGNISWSLPNGLNGAVIPDVTNLFVRLKLIVNEELEDIKYFTMKHSYLLQENKTETLQIMSLPCIYIAPSPNASLMVDMFLLDRKSCESDAIKENQTRHHSYIPCHMFPILQDEFPISKMSCHLYNHYTRVNHNLTPHIGTRAQRTSQNITIFDVYMTNVNPYSSVHVWVFPSEDPLNDLERYIYYDDSEDLYDGTDPYYDHIAFWQTWTNSAGEVRLFKTEVGPHHSQFFVKVVTSCPQNDQVAFYTDDIGYDDDFIAVKTSESFFSMKEEPEMNHQVQQRDDGLLALIHTSPEVMFGVVGGLVLTACIIGVLVWMKFHNDTFFSCFMNKENHVIPGREETHNNLLDIESTAPVINSMEHMPRTLLVHHANTTALQSKIKELEVFLTRNGVHVEQFTAELEDHWNDFAERAGSFNQHVIFVLSSDLLKLLDIYRDVDPKGSKLDGTYSENAANWTELMADRNWDISPCIVLNKLRILYNDRRILFRVHLVVFSDENLKDTSGGLHNNFLSMFYNFLNSDNTVCYAFNSNDLAGEHVQNSDCKRLLTHLLLSQS